LPGVTIGKNSIVGAHSLVNKDIPDNVVAFGVPAKVMRKLTNDK
jgi:acetyltransferase-like isoleucine patch superfamily enzyme